MRPWKKLTSQPQKYYMCITGKQRKWMFDYCVSLFWFRVFLFSFISARNKFTLTPYEVLTLPVPILDEVKKLS